jgi:hypothetical protein
MSYSAFGNIHVLLNQIHCNIDIAAQQQLQMLAINKKQAIFMYIYASCRTFMCWHVPAQPPTQQTGDTTTQQT